jgi:uncharacterized tellurite resistance protein B-like protein
MLQTIVNLLTGKSDAGGTRVNDRDRISIAACVILLEMAHADDDFSLVERDRLRRLLREELGLGADETEDVLSAAEREQRDATDLYAYTSIVNRNFSDAEKRRLIEAAWHLAYADGRVDPHEDHLLHRLAQLLHVEHAELIAAKLRARDANKR